MNEKIATMVMKGITITVGGVVAAVSTHAIVGLIKTSIETSNESDKRELDRRVKEFELRKEKAIKLEQHKDSVYKELEEKTKGLKEEIIELERTKTKILDENGMIEILASINTAVREIRVEVNHIKK